MMSPKLLLDWRKELKKDTDIIRHHMLKHDSIIPKTNKFKESCADFSWSMNERKNYFNEMDGEPRILDVF